MAKTLIESSEFVGSVSVPEGTDSRDNAANVVEAFVQKLVNRTKYLKEVHDLLSAAAARLTVPNTFTRVLTVNQANDPGEGLLYTSVHAHNSTANPTNQWRKIFSFATDNVRSMRLYTGWDASASAGALALTVNAIWNITGANANKWQRDTESDSAFALIVRNEGLFISRKSGGGTDTWASWPTSEGVAEIANMNAGAVNATGAVTAAGEIQHSPSRARTYCIPMLPFVEYGATQVSFVSGVLLATGVGSYLGIPLRIPLGCSSFNLRISLKQNGGIPSEYRIVRVVPSMGAGGSSTMTQVAVVYSDAVPGGDVKGILINSGHNLNPEIETYIFQWKPGQVGDQLFGLVALGWGETLKVASW